ncbi:MAG: hypothetical protein IJ865_01365, partial [Clostridia bacterium]|nr:hypothetical protein [Clostridia bacterium]
HREKGKGRYAFQPVAPFGCLLTYMLVPFPRDKKTISRTFSGVNSGNIRCFSSFCGKGVQSLPDFAGELQKNTNILKKEIKNTTRVRIKWGGEENACIMKAAFSLPGQGQNKE